MKKAVPYLITLILLLVMGGVFLKLYYDHYMYTDERVDLNAYYGVQDEDDFPVIYENLVSEMHARRFDGECYMDLDTVLSLLNDRFYYGTQDGTLIYCLPEEMFQVKEVTVRLPEKARLFDSYVCDCCWEVTGANWIRLAGDQKLCLDCYESYNRFCV